VNSSTGWFPDTQRRELDALHATVKELTNRVSVYGEVLDDLRNRVHDLEHGTPPRREES
jgi:hypothetical protein